MEFSGEWTQSFGCPICEIKFEDFGKVKGHIIDTHGIDPADKTLKKFEKVLTKISKKSPEKLMAMAIKAGATGKAPKLIQTLKDLGEELKTKAKM